MAVVELDAARSRPRMLTRDEAREVFRHESGHAAGAVFSGGEPYIRFCETTIEWPPNMPATQSMLSVCCALRADRPDGDPSFFDAFEADGGWQSVGPRGYEGDDVAQVREWLADETNGLMLRAIWGSLAKPLMRDLEASGLLEAIIHAQETAGLRDPSSDAYVGGPGFGEWLEQELHAWRLKHRRVA